MSNVILLDNLILVDETGMPKAPTIRQLIDKDVKELYVRDTTKDKSKYIAECIVIYYLADPKSPARQAGLSVPEAFRMAIEQAGLDKDYVPDALVQKLIKKYEKQNTSEATRLVDNILKTIHNINLGIDQINAQLNEKLNSTLTLEEIPRVLELVNQVTKTAGSITSIVKQLEEAKQNLIYEQETQVSRGGNAVISSMDADDYIE